MNVLAWAALAACTEAPVGPGPGEGPGSDTDTDTVPESPPDPPAVETGGSGSTTTCADTGVSSLAGDWVGACPTLDDTPVFGELTLTLSLAETCGDVTGEARLDYVQFTYYGGTTGGGGTPGTEYEPMSATFGGRGTFDGAVAVLGFGLPGGGVVQGLDLTATLDGDALAGPLTFSPDGTWVETYDCALDRQ